MKKSRILTLFLVIALCLATVLGATACDDNSLGLTLNSTSIQLYVNGTSETLRAKVSDIEGDIEFEWSVENEKVAAIAPAASACRVTPVGEGETTVTVKIGKISAKCTVKVGPDQHKQLAAPSFEYDKTTGIITISDNENGANVSAYELHFYDENGIDCGHSIAVSGEPVDLSRVNKGTYTVKLIAVSENPLYLNSDPSSTTATVEVTVDARVELGIGDAGALEKADNWAYYSFDWVIVSEAYYYNNEVVFSFENNVSENIKDYAWITQLIYNYGEGLTGDMYVMKLNINTTTAGRISLGGKVVVLKEGDNVVEVAVIGGSLFKIQFAVAGYPFDLVDATVKIKVLEAPELWTETKKLETPESFEYDAETNTVTVVDSKNNPMNVNYTLGLFEKMTDAQPKGTVSFIPGEPLVVNSVTTGTYHLKLMAATAGAPYTSSDWTDFNGTIDVKNGKVDILAGNEAAATNNPNKWYEWHPMSNMGMPQTTINEAYIDEEGAINVDFTNATDSAYYQPLKLFYNDTLINKNEFTFKCTITTTSRGHMTINGEVIAIREDVTEVVFTKKPTGKNTITIQFGAQITNPNDTEGAKIHSMVTGQIRISNIRLIYPAEK